MALLSDAFHMLFDMLAYVMAFAASYTAERFDRAEQWSHGLHRLEPVAVYVVQCGEMSLSERGAFYHLLGDAGGSVAVVGSTIAVSEFDLPIADPLAALFIGALVLDFGRR